MQFGIIIFYGFYDASVEPLTILLESSRKVWPTRSEGWKVSDDFWLGLVKNFWLVPAKVSSEGDVESWDDLAPSS